MSEHKDEEQKIIEVLEGAPQPRRTWRDPRLTLVAFLAVSIILAVTIVAIGHLLYINSSEYKLDITRPGLKEIEQKDLVEVDRSQQYDSSSPVDRKAAEDEEKSLNSRLQELDRYGDFADLELEEIKNDVAEGRVVNSQ